MRLNVNRYKELMELKGIGKEDIERQTGLTLYTLGWIFENEYLETSTLERLAVAVGCETNAIALPDRYPNENVIEWIEDSDMATVSLTQGKTITRVKKLAESRPEECRIKSKNADGSICARIPVGWIKINPERELSEEQREQMAERIRRNILYTMDSCCKTG